MVHKQILQRKRWPADELIRLSVLFRGKHWMYNTSIERGKNAYRYIWHPDKLLYFWEMLQERQRAGGERGREGSQRDVGGREWTEKSSEEKHWIHSGQVKVSSAVISQCKCS